MYKKIRKIYEIYYKKRRSFAEEINEVFNELSDTCIMSDTNDWLLGTFLSDKHFKK